MAANKGGMATNNVAMPPLLAALVFCGKCLDKTMCKVYKYYDK
jgi:hypothetical protein